MIIEKVSLAMVNQINLVLLTAPIGKGQSPWHTHSSPIKIVSMTNKDT